MKHSERQSLPNIDWKKIDALILSSVSDYDFPLNKESFLNVLWKKKECYFHFCRMTNVMRKCIIAVWQSMDERRSKSGARERRSHSCERERERRSWVGKWARARAPLSSREMSANKSALVFFTKNHAKTWIICFQKKEIGFICTNSIRIS